MAPNVPFVEWPEFYSRHFRWRQGEHVTCLGPTGCGKTTLLFAILAKRKYHVVFATKPKDPLIAGLKKEGYKIQRDLPLSDPQIHHRIVLWPKIDSPNDLDHQRQVFAGAIASVYRNGGWTLCLDEVRYQTEFLKLEKLVDLLWQQGRSLGVSLIVGAQRPAWIPLSAYDQASHLFIWRFHNATDLKRLSALGTIDSRKVIDEIRSLPRHETLYINTVDGTMVRTKVAV